jgi:hypothetical protein
MDKRSQGLHRIIARNRATPAARLSAPLGVRGDCKCRDTADRAAPVVQKLLDQCDATPISAICVARDPAQIRSGISSPRSLSATLCPLPLSALGRDGPDFGVTVLLR